MLGFAATTWQAVRATLAKREQVRLRGDVEQQRNQAVAARVAADEAKSLAVQKAATITRNLYFAEMNRAGQAAATLKQMRIMKSLGAFLKTPTWAHPTSILARMGSVTRRRVFFGAAASWTSVLPAGSRRLFAEQFSACAEVELPSQKRARIDVSIDLNNC